MQNAYTPVHGVRPYDGCGFGDLEKQMEAFHVGRIAWTLHCKMVKVMSMLAKEIGWRGMCYNYPMRKMSGEGGRTAEQVGWRKL